mgnify:CR=1 FL=1
MTSSFRDTLAERVLIMDECEDLLPQWLRFMRGVIDSDDLPLNVSRDVLQDSKVSKTIRKQVTKKSLELFEQIGAVHQIHKAQTLLATLEAF